MARDRFASSFPLVIVGAGACGLVAALTAREAGIEVLAIERDPVPAGSTALSSGQIPACGTRAQRAAGIADSVGMMADDIQAKAKGRNHRALVEAICAESGPTVDWLTDAHGVALTLVEGFRYPGHSRQRMHAPPARTGAELMAMLREAAARAGIELLCSARVTELAADGAGRVEGLCIERPDGSAEWIGCDWLILACNGFGGDRELVRRYIPEMADALYFGHPGNTGDALHWGEALGAAVEHMGAYQGHGSVATPHNILVTWALMMEGGIQVNLRGERFSNEHGGYSEQSVHVLNQPEGVAWNIYDARCHAAALQFEDYQKAIQAGAIKTAADLSELARLTHLPEAQLRATLDGCRGKDRFGRDFGAKPPLAPPYHAVKVTGALFHTQGGLKIDPQARVLRADGCPLPNLLAGGGAAAGISGETVDGYLSGNGLLSAVGLGRIAGKTVAGMAAIRQAG
ncbi:MAG: FAD-dependent oxidoreductase [Alphaproteobacteria bacterium]|nr:FAD-dependent oxidoreductase [Alphaproteobacteria bacterium]